MQLWPWIVAGALGGAAAVAALLWRPVRASLRSAEYERSRKDFRRQRERLEARFLQSAATSGKPRGLKWVDCDFSNDVTYARDRRSQELCAFVAVAISFEAIPGGGMEEVEAVGNLKAGTAVFRWLNNAWHTDGRVIFNLNPSEAIAYYQDSLEQVGVELRGPGTPV